MARVREVNPQYDPHLGDGNRRDQVTYQPMLTHQEIDARLGQEIDVFMLPQPVTGGTLSFPGIAVTTPSVAVNGTWGGSFDWPAADTDVLVRFIKVEHSTPTHIDFAVLRQPKFTEPDRSANVAFAAKATGEGFMREHLWDYTDEAETSKLHLWVHNLGVSASTFTFSLNMRTVQ